MNSNWAHRTCTVLLVVRAGFPALGPARDSLLAVVPVATDLGDGVVRMLIGGEYNSVKLPHYARIDVDGAARARCRGSAAAWWNVHIRGQSLQSAQRDGLAAGAASHVGDQEGKGVLAPASHDSVLWRGVPVLKARTGPGLFVALSLAVSSACDITRPPDLHPDVVALGVLLFAGESEAHLLAIHPHRRREDAAPNITATLEGPGWTAAFAHAADLAACTLAEEWLGPSKCLRAALPEAIRPDGAYGLHGTAPLGCVHRGDENAHPTAPARAGRHRARGYPGRWQSDRDSAPLRTWPGCRYPSGGVDGFLRDPEDGTEERLAWHTIVPLGVLKGDTIRVGYNDKPLRFSLRLLGVGWHYTDFVEQGGRIPHDKSVAGLRHRRGRGVRILRRRHAVPASRIFAR